MKKQSKKVASAKRVTRQQLNNIRFIVPMPGKSNWREPKPEVTLRQLHKFSQSAGDLGLEDFQANILMQREYLID